MIEAKVNFSFSFSFFLFVFLTSFLSPMTSSASITKYSFLDLTHPKTRNIEVAPKSYKGVTDYYFRDLWGREVLMRGWNVSGKAKNGDYLSFKNADDAEKFLEDQKAKQSKVSLRPKTAKEIFDYLEKTVVGQKKAKRNMAVAVVNHYKRLMHDDLGKVEKSNLLVVGPTGTGKTHMAKEIAKFLDVPIIIADATSLTESGYVGDDVENILEEISEVNSRTLYLLSLN